MIAFLLQYRKIIIVNIVFVLMVFLVLFGIYRNQRNNLISVPVPEENIFSGEIGSSTPIKVSIPAVGIEGNIVLVGRTKTGKMAVPAKYEDVGWYKYGPLPGAVGNAVLAGHLDNGKGKPAVFYNLRNIRIGDSIYVENSDGMKIKFTVKEVRLVDYTNPPLEDIFGNSSEEMLNLITCDGTWDPKTKNYDKRLVVFSERVRD